MEIELRTRSLIAELTIKSGNAKIEEDLAILNKGVATIPDSDIEKFITIAREMNNFNGKSDVDFVKMIYEAFLSDYERQTFLDAIS
jgi:phage pi2 protein 07